jgi:acetyl-CoA carboxylase alpha subunit
MVSKHLLIVHFVDMVAGENQNIIRIKLANKVYILENGVCSSLVPIGIPSVLIRRKNAETASGTIKIPRGAVTNIIIERKRLVLSQYTNGVNSGVNTVGKREINNSIFSAVAYSRLAVCFVRSKRRLP